MFSENDGVKLLPWIEEAIEVLPPDESIEAAGTERRLLAG
jgi:hypothetical protein